MAKQTVAIMRIPHTNGNVTHGLKYIRQGAEQAGLEYQNSTYDRIAI